MGSRVTSARLAAATAATAETIPAAATQSRWASLIDVDRAHNGVADSFIVANRISATIAVCRPRQA